MKKIFSVLAFIVISCAVSFGQDQEYQDLPVKKDWWIGASIGSTYSFADNAPSNNFVKNIPSLDFQLGTFFTKSFGVRIGGTIGPQTGCPDDAAIELDPEKYDTNYRFYTLNAYADAILDLTTLFGSKRNYRPTFDVMVFAGGGLLEAVHFDLKVKDWEDYPVDYQDKTCWSARVGLMTAYRFSPHWDWTLEGSYNFTESRYDGVEEDASVSGFLRVQTGFVYHIHHRDSKRFRLTTDIDSDWAPRYTQEDRERVRKEQRERIEKARKENEKIRKEKSEKIRQHNEEVKKANERVRKSKEERKKEWEEARKYNELIY